MASVAPPADQAADLLMNLSIDSQSKTFEIPEPTKKISVDTTFATNGQNQIPVTPDFMDPTVAYFPNGYPSSTYYYGGYDGTTNGYKDMSHGVYGDMYHGYGYTPYGPYSPSGSPLPTVTHDGQRYGSQQFQYPNPYFQPMTPTSGPTHPKGENAPSGPLTMDSTNGFESTTNSVPVKPTPFNANGSYKRGSQNGFQDPRYGYNGVYSPIPYLDFPLYPNEQAKKNSNITPVTNMNNVASRPINQMYGNKLYNQYGRDYQSFYAYGANAYNNFQSNYKLRGRGNGFFYNNENGDGLNELNRGPRTTRSTLAVNGQHVTSTVTDGVEKDLEVMEKVVLTTNREQYNQPDFRDSYEDAKFFVIKSYSEDDVHKSIKYNVWASTQNGNKKLDAAYQEAQQKSGSCPVFLFFSVNTSGQFVGIAEMIGPVDFNKSLEYWQQDKWIGCFPVKWHIVKDVPNSLLKHIILEYNENKPVTNSRDTQEVKLEQGLEVLKIFKEESSKQCILDDFDFYEDRQKRIQEKKAKQQQFHKQLLEEKPKEELKVDVVPPKSFEAVEETVKEVISVNMNGDVKLAEKQLQ